MSLLLYGFAFIGVVATVVVALVALVWACGQDPDDELNDSSPTKERRCPWDPTLRGNDRHKTPPV